MRLDDGLIGLLLIAFAAAVVAYAQTFPLLAGMQFGPALFPTVIGSGIGLCGLMMVIQSVLRRRAEPDAPWFVFDDWARTREPWLNILLVIVVVLAFGLSLTTIGYHLASLAALLVLLFRLKVRPLLAIVIAVAGSTLTHELFYGWLRVPLPWGVLEPVAW